MIRFLLKAIAAASAAILAACAIYIVGMRTKWPPVINSVRKFSRLFKRTMMKTAGTPGAYASIVKHIGRTSGRSYETPVQAIKTADGFVIALPYGSRSDWVRNVLANGRATIVHEGATYDVEQPALIPLASVERAFPPSDQRTHRLFRLEECLQVAHARTNDAATPAEAAR